MPGRGWVRSRTPSTACGDVAPRKSTISPLVVSACQINAHSLRSIDSMVSMIFASASSRSAWSIASLSEAIHRTGVDLSLPADRANIRRTTRTPTRCPLHRAVRGTDMRPVSRCLKFGAAAEAIWFSKRNFSSPCHRDVVQHRECRKVGANVDQMRDDVIAAHVLAKLADVPAAFMSAHVTGSLIRRWVRPCRFVTHAGNARSFPLCSQEIIIMAAAEAYAGFRVGDDS